MPMGNFASNDISVSNTAYAMPPPNYEQLDVKKLQLERPLQLNRGSELDENDLPTYENFSKK
jgi:hypothetical protein